MLTREAEHNLMLGLTRSLLKNPSEVPPYHALVLKNGQAIAAALRTPPYNLLLSHIADEDALGLLAFNVLNHYKTLPGVHGTQAKTFALIWEQIAKQVPFLAANQRLYRLDSVNLPTGIAGQMRFATDSDHDLLLQWIGAFYADIEDDDERTPEQNQRVLDRFTPDNGAGIVLWEVDGQPVSMAGYNSPTPHGIRISSVYTPPEHRAHGYASACVAHLSQYLLENGFEFCCLYTDLSNPTSNHIYQQIGYTPVVDVDIYEFI